MSDAYRQVELIVETGHGPVVGAVAHFEVFVVADAIHPLLVTIALSCRTMVRSVAVHEGSPSMFRWKLQCFRSLRLVVRLRIEATQEHFDEFLSIGHKLKTASLECPFLD